MRIRVERRAGGPCRLSEFADHWERVLAACGRTNCLSCAAIREELAERKARAAKDPFGKPFTAPPAIQDEAAEWRKLAVQSCPPGTIVEPQWLTSTGFDGQWTVDEGAEKKGEAE